MENATTTLLSKLREIMDLDEGRRDLPGILTRAAVAAREIIGGELGTAALTVDGSSTIAISEAESTKPRTETWDGPGTLGNLVLNTREAKCWSAGDGASPEPSEGDLPGIAEAKAWVGVPLPLSDRPAGLLTLVRNDGTPFTEDEVEMLRTLARFAGGGIGNLRTFQEVESLAVTDDLTRVYNYRFLKAALRREVERASRYGHSFSIIMIDVDHLKKYNEANGHLEGSELLRRVAGTLSRSSRAIDLVAKYGGDEFLIILPQTRLEGAITMSERICKGVARTEFAYAKPGIITVSIGAACFPEHGASMEALLAASDEALFRAKRAGRNRVETAQGPGNPSRIIDLV